MKIKICINIGLLLCAFACQNSSIAKLSQATVRITIVNKTTNKNLVDSLKLNIQEKAKLERIETALAGLKPIAPETVTKANWGYYEIVVYPQSGVPCEYDVIYTVYNGIIIVNRCDGLKYKNDEINSVLINLMSK